MASNSWWSSFKGKLPESVLANFAKTEFRGHSWEPFHFLFAIFMGVKTVDDQRSATVPRTSVTDHIQAKGQGTTFPEDWICFTSSTAWLADITLTPASRGANGMNNSCFSSVPAHLPVYSLESLGDHSGLLKHLLCWLHFALTQRFASIFNHLGHNINVALPKLQQCFEHLVLLFRWPHVVLVWHNLCRVYQCITMSHAYA